MRSLVTGVAGFIGSAVAQALVDAGHDVVGVDNLSTGYRELIPESVEFIEADLIEESTTRCLPRQQYDCVFHIGGQSGGIPSFADPVYDLSANAISTLRLLEWSRRAGVRRFIYASSMAVYGNASDALETDPLFPLTPYAVSKAASESYLRIASSPDLTCIALRLNNTYGPRQDLANLNQGMVSIFLAQAFSHGSIEVRGSGSRSRDFVFVDDVVTAFVLAAATPLQGYQAFNVATGTVTTVNELLEAIADAVPREVSWSFAEGTPGDQFRVSCDSSAIRSALGWSPRVDLHSGIRTTVDWYLDQRGGRFL